MTVQITLYFTLYSVTHSGKLPESMSEVDEDANPPPEDPPRPFWFQRITLKRAFFAVGVMSWNMVMFPGQIVTFCLKHEHPGDKILEVLKLAKSKTGILHRLRYVKCHPLNVSGHLNNLENCFGGWLQDRGYWPYYMGEDVMLINGMWWRYDRYDYFKVPVGINLYFYNAKILLQTCASIGIPYAEDIFYVVRGLWVSYVMLDRVEVALLYMYTGRPNPRRLFSRPPQTKYEKNGPRICTTPGGVSGLITEESLAYSVGFRKAQLLRDFRSQLLKYQKLIKREARLKEWLYEYRYEYLRQATQAFAVTIFPLRLLLIHQRTHKFVYPKLSERKANLKRRWLSIQAMALAKDTWELYQRRNMFTPYFDPYFLIAIVPTRSRMSLDFEIKQRVLITQVMLQILAAQREEDNDKVLFAQSKFDVLLNLREG